MERICIGYFNQREQMKLCQAVKIIKGKQIDYRIRKISNLKIILIGIYICTKSIMNQPVKPLLIPSPPSKNRNFFQLDLDDSSSDEEYLSNQKKCNCGEIIMENSSSQTIQNDKINIDPKKSPQDKNIENQKQSISKGSNDVNFENPDKHKFKLRKASISKEWSPLKQSSKISLNFLLQGKLQQNHNGLTLISPQKKYQTVKTDKNLTKHKKKIQLVNNSALLHDLQVIKLDFQSKKDKNISVEQISETRVRRLFEQFNNDSEKTMNQRKVIRNIFSDSLENSQEQEIKKKLIQSSLDVQNQGSLKQNELRKTKNGIALIENNVKQIRNMQIDQDFPKCQVKKILQHEVTLASSQSSQKLQSKKSSENNKSKKNSDMKESAPYSVISDKTLEIHRGMQISHFTFLGLYRQFLQQILIQPIDYSRQFQVIVYKDMLSADYQFWLKGYCNLNDDIHLATATKEGFHLDKTVFRIESVYRQKYQFQGRHYEYIGHLESNFMRDNYTLKSYNHMLNHRLKPKQHLRSNEENQIGYQQTKQLCQMANISLNAESQTYFRKTKYSFYKDDRHKIIPVKFQNINNLKKYYKNADVPLTERQNEIDVLRKVQGFELSQKLQKEFSVRKSDKNILLQNYKTKQQLIFIGKVSSKKYRILIGPKISSVQAFAFLIAHVESNSFK